MQRKSKEPERAKDAIEWVKKGGGSLRLNNPNRIIKPNQKFYATLAEIPEAFRDVVVPVSEKAKQEVEAGPIDVPLRFKIETKGSGWFDVINLGTGKAVNDKSLRAAEAKELLKELE